MVTMGVDPDKEITYIESVRMVPRQSLDKISVMNPEKAHSEAVHTYVQGIILIITQPVKN